MALRTCLFDRHNSVGVGSWVLGCRQGFGVGRAAHRAPEYPMPRPTSRTMRYLAAVIFTAVMLLIRWALDPWLGDAQPLSLLFGAVALAVWLGGVGPALVATALGYFASDYLFIPPRGVFAVVNVQEAVSLLTYLMSCAIIVAFGEGMRIANGRAHQHAKSLEHQQVQLERAERHKDEFLATLAHELRNPLASIANVLTFFARQELQDPQFQKALSIITRQVRHLSRLIDDLLDISRIAAGKLNLHKTPTELGTVLAEAIDCARPLIDAAGHRFDWSAPVEPIPVSADHTRLVQVFLNLLNNAIRYTPCGGHLVVEVRSDDEWATVRVCDSGMGIPADMLLAIFERFTQVERDAERTKGGLGIGLTLVRRLVEMHGGTIEACSDGVGRGSEFIVRLPILSRPQSPCDGDQPGERSNDRQSGEHWELGAIRPTKASVGTRNAGSAACQPSRTTVPVLRKYTDHANAGTSRYS
jgi:signal transduction histidine kinase